MMNEKYQLLMIIPVFIGALYAARRISGPGMSTSSMLRSRPRLIACIALTVLGAFCLGYMFFSHLEFQTENASLNRIFAWISGTYLAFFIYFLLALTVTDIICLILRHKGRRKMPLRLFMMVSVSIAALLTAIGLIHAHSIETTHYDLSSEKELSSSLRIVEVSDLHMGSVIGTAHVKRVVDAINACHPDIVVFLGDQFNRTTAVDIVDAEAMFETLSHIEATTGVYAVLGNHDPELDSEIYQKYLREGGITSLDNGVLEIVPGNETQQMEVRTLISASSDGSDSVTISEMSDDGAILLVGRTKLAKDTEREPLAKLLDEAGAIQGFGSDDNTDNPDAVASDSDHRDYYLLVLDHDPEGIAEAVTCDADLVIAGHTHRGQFFPGIQIMEFLYGKKYNYGMAQTINEISGHITTSIVSSGAGYFQTPVRVGTDSEIVCIDLRLDSE